MLLMFGVMKVVNVDWQPSEVQADGTPVPIVERCAWTDRGRVRVSTSISKELNSHLRPKKSSKKGSTAPRVPKSSLTSVLTGPVAA